MPLTFTPPALPDTLPNALPETLPDTFLTRAEPRAQLIVELTQLALSAPDIASAVNPALAALVERTAAVGSAYFQMDGGMFQARSAAGTMPQGADMDAILAHGLPAETPLMAALQGSRAPLFFDDTFAAPEAAGFPALGVLSLAAAPVLGRDGGLRGAFLMHTFEPHTWEARECDLFGTVATTLAALAARLVAEEQALAEKANALRAKEGAIKALGVAVESRDSETKGHTDRVTDLALSVGRALGLGAEDLDALRWGAYLHDLGKVATPDAILHKPGKLTPDEWVTMRAHAESGYKIALQLPFLPQATLETILYHHERYDGAGYPHSLAGPDVPLLARIFSVCDVYDALTSVRPYKSAWSHEKALAELHRQAGRQFDPAVVTAFAGLCELD